MTKNITLLDQYGHPLKPSASYEGAGNGFGGELGNWQAFNAMADQHILPNKNMADARAGDLIRNHGMASGGIQSAIDNIVGDNFKLSCKPNYKALGISAEQAREFATQVEAGFNAFAEDERCYIDAERKRTFTMLIRSGIENHKRTGEIMASAEWIARPGSKFKTAIKLISASRVCNPQGKMNSDRLRAGVVSDAHGAAIGYYVKTTKLNGLFAAFDSDATWLFIPRETKWGRAQFLHIFEPFEDGQTRALTAFVSVLSRLKMLDKYQGTKLQNAILNATYAATIESELDSKTAFEIIGEADGLDKLTAYIAAKAEYNSAANIRFNGVKVSHLVPGEKLHLNTPGNVDNGYSDFEASMLRHVAAGLNISYEQLSRDYSKVSYSSARASILESWRYSRGQKKVIADRFANGIFQLWLEEAVSNGTIKLPAGFSKSHFWQNKAAWCKAAWIGAGRTQIDGLKEVKEAVLRIESGLSTYEKECALMGEDYQEMFEQQCREIEERKAKGLPPPSYVQTQLLAPDNQDIPEDTNNAPPKSNSSAGTE